MEGILGTKLRRERELMGLTQKALAKAVGLSSEFVSQLELGKRMPSVDSLTALASFFKKDVSFFLKEKEDSFNVLLRGEELDKKTRAALKKFKKYCEDYLFLEDITGRRLELGPLYTQSSAERMAEEERHRLGFGDEPIRNIFSLLELNGLHILRLPLPEKSKISGVFVYFEVEKAAFALINSEQSSEEQVFIAAHEYCHYLKDRNAAPIIDNPDVFVEEFVSLYHPREKFALTFAEHFLVPPSMVKKVVDKDLQSKKLNLSDVLYLQSYFGVSTSAMLQALRNLQYLSRSRFQEYRGVDLAVYEGFFSAEPLEKRRFIKEKRGVILPNRYKRLAIETYRKKRISEEKMFQLFGLHGDKTILALSKLKQEN